MTGFHKDAVNEKVWDVVEFFILRGYRGRRIGAEVAQELWRRFPGGWEVRVMALNEPAYRFWRRAIASFSEAVRETHFEQGGTNWHRFSFESKGDTRKPGHTNDETD